MERVGRLRWRLSLNERVAARKIKGAVLLSVLLGFPSAMVAALDWWLPVVLVAPLILCCWVRPAHTLWRMWRGTFGETRAESAELDAAMWEIYSKEK